jgi:O-methyltransferase
MKIYYLIRRLVHKLISSLGSLDKKPKRFHEIYRKYHNYTRVPEEVYCDNLSLVRRFKEVPGCIVECGVWKGGMIAGIAEVIGPERSYFLFDSFEGLPNAKEVDGKKAFKWQNNNLVANCRTEEYFAYESMRLSGARKFTVTKGWFNNTLPGYDFGDSIAILRLDADWYNSTMECLNALYEKVTPGGLIVVDDYYAWDGCAKAIHDFLSTNRLSDRIQQFRGRTCFIKKE